MKVWNDFLEILNTYGGLVGLISLIFSIWIFINTGNIKKDILQARQTKGYRVEKRNSVKKLEEMMASIKFDQVYDAQMKTDVLIEVNKLGKYKVFLDWPSKYYIFRVNYILRKDMIDEKNSAEIISCVSKLCGRMSVEPVNTEVR